MLHARLAACTQAATACTQAAAARPCTLVITSPGAPLPESLQRCHLLVMEACEGGELFARVHSQQAGLSEAEAAPILMQARCATAP